MAASSKIHRWTVASVMTFFAIIGAPFLLIGFTFLEIGRFITEKCY